MVFSSQRTMTLSIANSNPPRVHLDRLLQGHFPHWFCWTSTEMRTSGMVRTSTPERESQHIFAKLSLFLVYLTSEALQNQHGIVFFGKITVCCWAMDGMNATGRDDFGNLRLSIFKEDVLHANVTNWCCDGNAVGLAAANPLPSHSGRWGCLTDVSFRPQGSQQKTHRFGSHGMNW